MTHWFTGIRLLLIAVLVAAVAIAWQANVADATEDNAATFTVCSDKQGRLRMAEVEEDCTSNEEFIELDLVTGQALDDAVQGLEEKIDELETDLLGQIAELEADIDAQADEIKALEERVDALEDDSNGTPDNGDLGDRVTELEVLLDGVSRTDDGLTLQFAGVNVQIVNGHDDEFTDTANGLGNLIIGYNEKGFGEPNREGSHNLVIGIRHSYPGSGGLVVGQQNTISGDFASVTGGIQNTASGGNASVSGGQRNTAEGQNASVSGGSQNTASGVLASVSGGVGNTALGPQSSVTGGFGNTASHSVASVSGGSNNTASGFIASVSGGEGNVASGDHSSILGGKENTVDTEHGLHPEPY